jgi:hypothetical protein
MIDRETWEILAERCATIRRLRAERELPDDVTLEFDTNDQARVVPLDRNRKKRQGGRLIRVATGTRG